MQKLGETACLQHYVKSFAVFVSSVLTLLVFFKLCPLFTVSYWNTVRDSNKVTQKYLFVLLFFSIKETAYQKLLLDASITNVILDTVGRISWADFTAHKRINCVVILGEQKKNPVDFNQLKCCSLLWKKKQMSQALAFSCRLLHIWYAYKERVKGKNRACTHCFLLRQNVLRRLLI